MKLTVKQDVRGSIGGRQFELAAGEVDSEKVDAIVLDHLMRSGLVIEYRETKRKDEQE
jgi:hypothetical protein